MAARKKAGRRKYGRAASKSVESAMRRRKKGTLRSGKGGRGGKVKSRKQAVAIAPYFAVFANPTNASTYTSMSLDVFFNHLRTVVLPEALPESTRIPGRTPPSGAATVLFWIFARNVEAELRARA